MSLSIVHSRTIAGLVAVPVRVEADLANGLPNFSIVGLPDAVVRESRDRVRAAIVNSGFEFPQRRVTVNLAPADLPKESGRFDLPIALGILAASQQIPAERLQQHVFVGELSLTGALMPVRGAFALGMSTMQSSESRQSLLVPLGNQAEASLIGDINLVFAQCLKDVTDFLSNACVLSGPVALESKRSTEPITATDWSEIQGQQQARRAAVVAAAGRHNLLMFGPPGVGKSMIASRMADLLPPLDHCQACELAAIRSLGEGVDVTRWRRAPYRSPHHSTSARAMIGGGQPLKPGEISLAHHGVLFLDELPEFSRDALEALREPLEEAHISIARVRERIRYPADVMLVAAMNPCPCGYFGAQHLRKVCKCPPDRITRYREKISGPLLDRFDMAVQMQSPSADQWVTPGQESETSESLRSKIQHVREIQQTRQSGVNARLSVQELRKVARLESASEKLLQQSSRKWGWSARAWHRTLRVARTIADLEDSQAVRIEHVSEAIELRRAMDVQ